MKRRRTGLSEVIVALLILVISAAISTLTVCSVLFVDGVLRYSL